MGERTIFLVWGTRGEYSDRSEWPVAAYDDEASAQAAVAALKEAARDLYEVYRRRRGTLDGAGDWDGKGLLSTTDEGKRFAALHGDDLAPGSYDFDDMEFTCCAVPLRDHHAIWGIDA